MSNPELCCNCAQWDTCKAEGVLPNDYCGMYEPEQTTKEQAHCDNWRKEHHFCNGCEYSTEDHDCKIYDKVFTVWKADELKVNAK